LSAARLKMRGALVVPITERVQRGHKTFYRARFAGFDKASAETPQAASVAHEC
jgi:hypothetical protein